MVHKLSAYEIKEAQEEMEYAEKHRPISTVERIRASVVSGGRAVGRSVEQFRNNPTVKKAGKIVEERAEVFQRNISNQNEPHPQPRSPPAAPHKKHKGSKQPKVVYVKEQSAPRQEAQGDPFGINLGGGKKPPGKSHNPFGI